MGAQIGVIQKRIDTDNFRFENQYQNWVFDQNANSGEMITNFSETNLGVHLGGLWEYDISSKLRYTLGMSGFEINNPSENFLNEQKNRLSVRLSLHTGIDYQIAPRLLISIIDHKS